MATPAVAASSVAAGGQDSLVRGSLELRSPLSPPSLLQREDWATCAGAFLVRRSYSLVATSLPLLQRSSKEHPPLPIFLFLTKQSKRLYLH